MFAAATQSLSDIDAIKLSSLSPPLAEAGPQTSAAAATSQSSSTEKLSALDTLSLAASAALNQRDPKQAVASTGAGATPLPSFASSEQQRSSNVASHEPISPSAQSATSSSSNTNNSNNKNNNLALLCGEAASKNPENITGSSIHNKYTTSSAPNHNLFSQQQPLQPSTPDDSEFISPGLRAGSGSPTSSTLQFPSNSTLPNLSTLLPHHPLPLVSSTTPPASTPDLSDNRWNYQKPQQQQQQHQHQHQQQKHHMSPNASAGNGSLLSQSENSIHPQLAALSGLNASNGSSGSNNYDTFSSTNGCNTYSPMSIASLTTPMYSSNASSTTINSNNSINNNGNKDHPMLLPKDGQEHPSNKRKFYSGIMETSFDPSSPNMVKSNNTANSINAFNNTSNNSDNSNIQSNNQTHNSSSARKKRQCTQCNGWFSNLATHKSTHLADNSRPHTCEICNRGFARPNDLFRHSKSHRGDAPFRCPLFVRGPLPNHAFGNLELSCHQNGGFSRCDTYKNHLKAMHFEYPPGTKKKQRNGMKGNCKACGMSFPSSDAWITDHIDPGNCTVIKQIKALKEASQL